MSAEYSSGRPGLAGSHYGAPGLGVLGSVIRATTASGAHGPGFLFNDLTVDDDAKEIVGRIITPPSAGVLFAYEAGSFDFSGAPDGAYSFTYRLYADGVDQGTATASITVGTVVLAAPVNSSSPTITGSAVQGQLLTASTGTWANGPTSYAYRWVRGATTIAGATASTYTLQAGDVGSQIRVGVIASNATGASAEALSAQTAVVAALGGADTTAPALSGAIAITLLATTGYTATCPAATDAVGVTGYQYRINAGAWVLIGAGARVVAITGRTPGATDALEMRAVDAAGNTSTALAASVTLLVDADVTPPSLSGSIVIGALASTSYTATCPVATDAAGVTGYQYRINAGAWVTIAGGGRAVSITGRTPAAVDALEMRAFDAAGNFSTALAASVTLADEVDLQPPTTALARYTLLPRVDQTTFIGGFDKMDPAELVTLAFDFSKSAALVQEPEILISQVSGPVDPTPMAMQRGLPAIVGGKVLQRMRGGVAGCIYEVRCQVSTAEGSRYVMAGLLPVQTARAL